MAAEIINAQQRLNGSTARHWSFQAALVHV
jgi:hypothetical protein